MTSDFIRSYTEAMPDDLCDTLIAWFDQAEDVRIEEANRLTRKDKQKWLTFNENSDLYTRVQKVKYDMMHRYLTEFPFVIVELRSLYPLMLRFSLLHRLVAGFITGIQRFVIGRTCHDA